MSIRKALEELLSIVEIHQKNTGNNFAWAEVEHAKELLAQPEPDKNLSFYITEYNIPTLEIGTGSVIIGDLYALDGTYSGVSFSKTESGEINKTHKETFGKDVVENNAFFQIISTNPKSTKVLIDKLKLSYDNFGINHPKDAKQEQDLKREPLSDNELNEMADKYITDEACAGYFNGFRDAEKAHGIGVSDEY